MGDQRRSWTEKYRPSTLDDVVGNPSAIRELREWAQAWTEGRPDKPGVLLAGDPGLGKTSAALALANDMGWSTIELNASDTRTKGAIKETATRGAVTQGFSETGEYQDASEAKRKLIILDEADNVFGREDRGGMQQIARTLKQTQQPIVLIANDEYELNSSAIKRNTKQIDFDSVQSRTIAKLLRKICQAEAIDADQGAITALAEHANGDVRAAVSDLESIARSSGSVTLDHVQELGYRDSSSSVFEALEGILQADGFTDARQASFDLDEDPETLLLWIEENVPREYTDKQDMAAGMRMVARADEFLGVTQRTRNYRFWSYASDLMTGGVAAAKTNHYSGWTRYQFPSWLRKMGRSKKSRKLRDDFGGKVGEAYHTGTKTAREHVIPTLSFVAQEHRPMAVHLAAKLDLTDDELGLLLDMGSSTKTVAGILEDAEELSRQRGQSDERVSISVPETSSSSDDTAPAPSKDADEEPGDTDEAEDAETDEDEADPDPDDDVEQTGLMDF